MRRPPVRRQPLAPLSSSLSGPCRASSPPPPGRVPDFVLDCIDDVETKAALLAACLRRGLPVLSSAGAGGRADPTRLCFADLSECSVDALARSVRHRLRVAHGVDRGIPVLFSS